ncbi:MAG: NifB/NifX family molybdenum-iron cluster-binding protein [Methanocorpusculum sp.]|uniref:NifB/NifX family molybdenum-iron cluster-binding protein n=1 Tax=Methanocorpusculum sp. TaxID=2058474 RepID=UPI002720309B|nr:NifB/NifX family molybdenum-iron cluster-binding protein [Methanocorpusculum sp.]MDO9522362.1 NifB/NifX family molybdenum-iron cluster-binding protein [Methanocorpusculum sp.]
MTQQIKKIAIAQDGSLVSQHFGHCMSYALFNLEDGKMTRLPDLENPGHEPGKLPRLLAAEGVNIVIAGGMGPRAIDLFEENGIQVILGVSGDLGRAAEAFANGTLTAGTSSCSHDDHACGGEEHTEQDHPAHIVCISSTGTTLDSPADMKFGRAPYFAVINLSSNTASMIQNSFTDVESGVGPKVVQLLASNGVSVLITGRSGVNASAALKAGGIAAYELTEPITIAEALQKYLAHELSPLL